MENGGYFFFFFFVHWLVCAVVKIEEKFILNVTVHLQFVKY